MDTTLYGGPVAAALHGADLAYYVAVVAAVAVYALLRRVAGPGGPVRETSSALG